MIHGVHAVPPGQTGRPGPVSHPSVRFAGAPGASQPQATGSRPWIARLEQAAFWAKTRLLPLSMATFTVIDTETTGLDPATSELIEVTAIRFRNGREVGRFSSLVKPGGPIPPRIQALTHITDAMVADAPEPARVLRDLVRFVGPAPLLVGHYAHFDIEQIRHRLAEHGLGAYQSRFDRQRAVCTKTLGQVIFPELRLNQVSGSLIALGQHLNVVNKTPHRAESDVRTTAGVLFALWPHARRQGWRLRTVADLMHCQGPAITQYDGLPQGRR